MPEPAPVQNGAAATDPDPIADTTQVATDAPTEKPLPAFLEQSRSEIQHKFIDLEWQQRNRIAQGLRSQGHPSEEASRWALLSGDEVTARNRYANVEVFANNRIKLRVPAEHCDYINASPIRLKGTKHGAEKYFIATQGPKQGIHGHIWRMIWQECGDTAVIVMLTQTHEAGREKCFQYFPADMLDPELAVYEGDDVEDDFKATLTLNSIEYDSKTQSTIREMTLRTEDGRAKQICHLLFSGWPDFSIPEDESRDALIRLIQLSSARNTFPNSPVIVHCSAGVGRSGTFIALDWLLTELEDGSLDSAEEDGEDPVTAVVDRLRQQRMMMVQSESQFHFLYEILRQLWRERAAGRSVGGALAAEPGEQLQKKVDSSQVLEEELEREMWRNAAEASAI